MVNTRAGAGQRVVVTGATSMLGAAVVAQLVERGDVVTTLQRRASPRPVDGVTEILGDIGDPATATAAVAGHDAVIHLAAKVDVVGDWAAYERTNLHGTVSLFGAARDVGVGRFVYVSTPSVAHSGRSLVAADADAADPSTTRGHYATSKAMAEQHVLSAEAGSMAVVAIRPHLVWGPGDTQLVGRMVDRARQGRLATIGTGAVLIDSTYVDNAADALVAALDRCDVVSGQVFVVSNGEPRPVAELVDRIVAAHGESSGRKRVPARLAFVAGRVIERVWGLANLGEPPITSFVAEQMSTAHWFDQAAVRRALDWTPKVSIDEGFERLAAAHRGLS